MEDAGGYWRRLHRKGHARMRTVGGSVTKRRRNRLHRNAGLLARMADGMARTALRTRSLAWWRYRQRRLVGRHCDLHPKRFSALSWWEAQLTATTEKLRQPTLNSTSGGLPSRPTAVCGRAEKTRSPTGWMRNFLVVVLPCQAGWRVFPTGSTRRKKRRERESERERERERERDRERER